VFFCKYMLWETGWNLKGKKSGGPNKLRLLRVSLTIQR
jgi:hypothetical protein